MDNNETLSLVARITIAPGIMINKEPVPLLGGTVLTHRTVSLRGVISKSKLSSSLLLCAATQMKAGLGAGWPKGRDRSEQVKGTAGAKGAPFLVWLYPAAKEKL